MERKHFPWATLYVIALTLVASFAPVIPAPFPSLTLGTRSGQALYVLTLVALGAATIIAQMKADSRRETEQAGRDTVAEKRHTDGLALQAKHHTEDKALQEKNHTEAMKLWQELAKQLGGSQGAPQIKKLGLEAGVQIAAAAASGTTSNLAHTLAPIRAQIATMGKATIPMPTIRFGDIFKPTPINLGTSIVTPRIAEAMANLVSRSTLTVTDALSVSRQINTLAQSIPNLTPTGPDQSGTVTISKIPDPTGLGSGNMVITFADPSSVSTGSVPKNEPKKNK